MDIPGFISISVEFDKELQKITKTKGHPVVMSQGSTFAYLLQNIFIEYPQIEKKYPPGTLGFVTNGFPPKIYSPLLEGDIISFSVNI